MTSVEFIREVERRRGISAGDKMTWYDMAWHGISAGDKMAWWIWRGISGLSAWH